MRSSKSLTRRLFRFLFVSNLTDFAPCIDHYISHCWHGGKVLKSLVIPLNSAPEYESCMIFIAEHTPPLKCTVRAMVNIVTQLSGLFSLSPSQQLIITVTNAALKMFTSCLTLLVCACVCECASKLFVCEIIWQTAPYITMNVLVMTTTFTINLFSFPPCFGPMLGALILCLNTHTHLICALLPVKPTNLPQQHFITVLTHWM